MGKKNLGEHKGYASYMLSVKLLLIIEKHWWLWLKMKYYRKSWKEVQLSICHLCSLLSPLIVNKTLILLTRKENDPHYVFPIKKCSLKPPATGARLAVCSPMGRWDFSSFWRGPKGNNWWWHEEGGGRNGGTVAGGLWHSGNEYLSRVPTTTQRKNFSVGHQFHRVGSPAGYRSIMLSAPWNADGFPAEWRPGKTDDLGMLHNLLFQNVTKGKFMLSEKGWMHLI